MIAAPTAFKSNESKKIDEVNIEIYKEIEKINDTSPIGSKESQITQDCLNKQTIVDKNEFFGRTTYINNLIFCLRQLAEE